MRPLLASYFDRAHLDHQSIVRRRYAVRQSRRQLRMRRVMREVREKGASRADLQRRRDSLGDREMQRMRARQQGVQHQDLESCELGPGRVGDLLRVGKVGHRSDAVSQHGAVAVGQRERAHPQAGDLGLRIRVEGMGAELGLTRPRLGRGGVEDVPEASPQFRQRGRRAVHREAAPLPHREGAQVVDAVDVVGMRVGEEHGIECRHTRRHELESQLGGRVDQQPPAARLDQRRSPGALVPRVGGGAGAAGASDLRHTVGSARPEEHEPHFRRPRP